MPFSNKRDQESSKKWLILGLGQRTYNMSLEPELRKCSNNARAGVDKSRGPRSQARKLAEVSAVVTAAKQ